MSKLRWYTWHTRPSPKVLERYQTQNNCELVSIITAEGNYTAYFKTLPMMQAETAPQDVIGRMVEVLLPPTPKQKGWTKFDDQYPKYGRKYEIRHNSDNCGGNRCTYDCTYIRLEDGGQFIIKQWRGYGRGLIDETYLKPSKMTQFHLMEWRYL